MRLLIDIEGSLDQILRSEVQAAERAVSTAVATAGAGIKEGWRQQVRSAGLAGFGGKLANTIRLNVYPSHKYSVNAAALVWTKAPHILGAHEIGALIQGQDRFGGRSGLAIPLQAAGRGPGGRKMTPEMWERKHGRRLRIVERPGQPFLLVDDGTKAPGNVMVLRRKRGRRGGLQLSEPRTFKNRIIPIFLIVRRVKLPKRLNLFSGVDAAANRFAGQIVRNWK